MIRHRCAGWRFIPAGRCKAEMAPNHYNGAPVSDRCAARFCFFLCHHGPRSTGSLISGWSMLDVVWFGVFAGGAGCIACWLWGLAADRRNGDLVYLRCQRIAAPRLGGRAILLQALVDIVATRVFFVPGPVITVTCGDSFAARVTGAIAAFCWRQLCSGSHQPTKWMRCRVPRRGTPAAHLIAMDTGRPHLVLDAAPKTEAA